MKLYFFILFLVLLPLVLGYDLSRSNIYIDSNLYLNDTLVCLNSGLNCPDLLSNYDCSDGEILKFNSGVWFCDKDNDRFNLSCPKQSIFSFRNGNLFCTLDKDTFFNFVCSPNQILVYDGIQFVCDHKPYQTFLRDDDVIFPPLNTVKLGLGQDDPKYTLDLKDLSFVLGSPLSYVSFLPGAEYPFHSNLLFFSYDSDVDFDSVYTHFSFTEKYGVSLYKHQLVDDANVYLSFKKNALTTSHRYASTQMNTFFSCSSNMFDLFNVDNINNRPLSSSIDDQYDAMYVSGDVKLHSVDSMYNYFLNLVNLTLYDHLKLVVNSPQDLGLGCSVTDLYDCDPDDRGRIVFVDFNLANSSTFDFGDCGSDDINSNQHIALCLTDYERDDYYPYWKVLP